MRNGLVILLWLSITVVRSLNAQIPDLSRISTKKGKVQAVLDYCSVLRLNKNSDPDNYKILQQEAATGLNLITPGDEEDRASFCLYEALGYYYQLRFDSAQYYFYQSLYSAQHARSVKLIAGACEALMSVNFQLQQPRKVEECKNILESIADTTKNRSILQDIYSAFGTYYQQKSFYSTAQDYFIRSIQIREKEADTARDPKTKFDYAIQCDQLSKLYLNTDMADKSIAVLRQGERFAGVSPLAGNRLLSSFVEAFTTSGHIDSALYYNEQLEKNAKNQAAFSSEIITSNLNIAIYYIDHKQYDRARPFLDNGTALAAETQSPLMIFQEQMIRGRFLEETGSYPQAIRVLNQSLPVARQLDKQLYANILKSLALSYKGLADTKTALQYYEQYAGLQDTITKEKVSRTFADLETHYQANEKEIRITALDQQNKLNVLELRQASNTRDLLILGLISLGIFFLLLYFIYRNKEKTNKLLNQRNAQLDELNHQLSVANETKAKLFGVISHDLRTPVSRIVSLLHLRKEHPAGWDDATRKQYEARLNTASENVLETMEDLLLWSKSQMENFTPRFEKISIRPLLLKEAGLLGESTREKNLAIEIKCAEEITRNTDENFLAVILRNLLQNAIARCAPADTICMAADERMISISNPAGKTGAAGLNSLLQKAPVSSGRSGLGLQIVKDLAGRIGIKIHFESEGGDRIAAVLTWC